MNQEKDQKTSIWSGILPALAMSGGTSLLGGLFEGLAMAQQRKWQKQDRAELEGKLKPSMPYFQTPYLQQYNEALTRLIMGRLADRYGGKLDRWGINIQDIFNSGALTRRYSGRQ